jgi:hypothetical protein
MRDYDDVWDVLFPALRTIIDAMPREPRVATSAWLEFAAQTLADRGDERANNFCLALTDQGLPQPKPKPKLELVH